jgi:hypothetical protein
MATSQSYLSALSDRELLDETLRMAGRARTATADLLALLAEVDSRGLYFDEGCSSLFTYCTHVLRLSEPAAYARITAARAARRFPAILARLEAGEVTLTSIGLLASHFTEENHEALLDAARHKSKRDVEELVATVAPQPDLPSTVRKLPSRDVSMIVKPLPESNAQSQDTRRLPERTDAATAPPVPHVREHPDSAAPAESAPMVHARDARDAVPEFQLRRAIIAPLSPERYLIRITVSRETHDRLQLARDLLRHVIPNGDVAVIFDRAMKSLVGQLRRSRLGFTDRPRQGPARQDRRKRKRHVPAAVKREVWARDEGRCAFVGTNGRCTETGFLELHHLVPYAAGGKTDAGNLQLRCRAHNRHEAERYFGKDAVRRRAAHGESSLAGIQVHDGSN